MSTATETCACGASITVDVRDGLTLGFRLGEWRKEHQHDVETARLRDWKASAMTVLAEWEKAWDALGRPGALGESKAEAVRASVLAARDDVEAARAEVEKARTEIEATKGALARGRASAAALARVRNLCNERPQCAHGLDCHCDCLAVADVRAAADTNRPIDEEEDTP